MLTIIVAVLALAYGVVITFSSLHASDKFAGNKCTKTAVKANNGLIVMGGIMMALSVSYLACQGTYSSCRKGKKDFLSDNSMIFCIGLIAVSITCITLSIIAQQEAKKNKDCPNIDPNTHVIWIPACALLTMGLSLVGFHYWLGGYTSRGKFRIF